VNAYLGLDALKQYITLPTTGLYPNGFAPYPGKKYLFDAWVNDGHPADKNINVTLSINGGNVPLTLKAVVEGWKLLEGTMDLSTLGHAASLNISVQPKTGFAIYIDDIRMHPFQALMKTYAYDDQTMRLMAEIDENGFATFYEYDDEGLLVRVKKETEKGVMTLKESRSTYMKNTK
jgi:YD repeat-containing protein